ncbi:hypothetical protein ACI797_20800 [Geodermatophilus sp. SYSU D00691]
MRLLGRTWMLRRTPEGLEVDPPAWGVRERLGLVWLAPAEPRDVPLEVPEARDRRFVARWLQPQRSTGPAGTLLDTVLDPAHVPFVHPGTCHGPEQVVPSVVGGPGGFDGLQEQADGRRMTYAFRAPFQLRLRLDHLATGAATTTLFLLQPEDADSTRIYSCVLLSAGPGQPLPGPGAVAEAVGTEERVLAEDLALHVRLTGDGLPLDPRDELHVRADRLGVALRRSLCDFQLAGRARAAA